MLDRARQCAHHDSGDHAQSERVAQSAEAARCAGRAIALDPGQGHAFSILGIHGMDPVNPARALEMAFEAYARDPMMPMCVRGWDRAC